MGNAFLYGNGGGTELAIKIVGGTQRPEIGKQGTIWINTDQKITGWTIQVQEPTNPTEGIVWIYNLTSTKLNILKKNGIWFTPTSAKQYIGGAWVKKTGEYYNNGQWVALFAATIHVTYPAGSTCTATDGVTTIPAPDSSGTWDCIVSNTGTWTVTIANGEDVGSVAVDVQWETDYLVFIPDQTISWDLYNVTNSTAITDTTRASVDASNSGTTIKLHPQASTYNKLMARKTIDLTNWSQIILDATITVTGAKNLRTTVGVFSGEADFVTVYETGYVTGDNTFDVSLNADISALSGEYYIGAYAHSGSSQANMYSTIKINSCIFVRQEV